MSQEFSINWIHNKLYKTALIVAVYGVDYGLRLFLRISFTKRDQNRE